MTFSIELSWWSLLWLVPASTYILWLAYVFTMGVRERWDTLPMASKVLAFLPVVFAYLLDIAINVVIITVLYWEIPKEVTLTKRLHRWQMMSMRHPIRARKSKWVCENILNPFDKGHC